MSKPADVYCWSCRLNCDLWFLLKWKVPIVLLAMLNSHVCQVGHRVLQRLYLRRTNLCNCAWIGHGRRLYILWRHGSYHCHYFCRSCSSVSGNCCVCGLTCLQTHRLIEPPVSMKQSKLLHTSSHHISLSISKSYVNANEKYRQERKAPHNTRTRARSAPTVIFWRLPLRGMLCVRKGRFCCNRNLSRDHLFGNALPLQMQQNSTATQGVDSCLATSCHCLITCNVQAESAA